MKKNLKILIAEGDPANANLLDLLKKKGVTMQQLLEIVWRS